MAIARKKQSPASSKPSKSPASIAEDPGALATSQEMAKSKAASKKSKDRFLLKGKEVSREEFLEGAGPGVEEILEKVDAIKTGKKKATGKKTTETGKAIKTTKKKPEVSQNPPKDTDPEIVQNRKNAQKEKDKAKEAQKRTAEHVLTCTAYAESLVQKSRYKETDVKKLIFAAFLALPESENITKEKFAECLGVHRNTLINWRFDKKVLQARTEIIERHFQGFTPGVLQALVDGAKRTSWVNGLGDSAMIKLFLQYVEKWNEKSELDLTSGGETITWGVAPSQFIKKDAIPEAEEEDEDPDD